MMEHYRGRMPTVIDSLEAVETELQSAAKPAAFLCKAVPLAAFIGLIATFTAGIGPLIVFVLFIGIAATVGAFAWLGSMRDRIARAEFSREVCALLADEVLPRSTVDVQFDRTSTQDYANLERTASSSSGNTKHYYKQRWFRMTLTLPDQSIVQVSRKAFKKTKKGSVNKHYRYLSIKVRPRGDLQHIEGRLHLLRGMLREAIRTSFHDPPEDVQVHPKLTDGALRIKIVQHDAPILPGEVLAIIQATMGFVYAKTRR